MSDGSDSKKPSIPTWQKQTPEKVSDTTPGSSTDAKSGPLAQDRTALVEQAKVFLQDASMRDTPREKKVAFLEKKGLSNEEIQQLLVTTSSEPTSPPVQEDNLTTIHDSSNTSSTPQNSPSSLSSQANSPSQPIRDNPPIITYPEFLLRPTKPPPLITLQRLTYALYTFAGISALTYGASKYLVQPMLESLTSARHDLSTTTLHNLEKLNEKLEGAVSHIPPTSNSALPNSRERDTSDTSSDIETVDSDPTELFHRDIGVQTSPALLSRSPSTASTLPSPSHHHNQQEEEEEGGKSNTTTSHSHRLHTLKTSLSSLLPPPENPTDHDLSTAIKSLKTYLSSIQLNAHSTYYADYAFLYDANIKTKASSAKNGDAEDEVTRFRQEIRALKGAFLSARTFPPATATATAAGTGVRGFLGGAVS